MIAAITLVLTGIAQANAVPTPNEAIAPMIRVGVPTGRCRVTIDGKAHTLTSFANVVETWRGSSRHLALAVDPAASYRCVNRMLAILKTAESLQLGFIGNEYVEPEKTK